MSGTPAAFVAALLAGMFACTAAAWSEARDFSRSLKSVVSVLPEWPKGSYRADEPEGSGVVVIDGRSILTALHVVEKALSIRVRTSSGDIVGAKLIGTDRATDLALLRVDDKLEPIEFGEDARLGDPVCAIGNAFGLGLSVTCGTVSAVNRSGVGFNAIEDFVQIDAAVNPGASGGALIGQDGRLVGVLSAIYTKTSDANIGVNFAVSAPLSQKVAKALLTSGKVAWRFGGAGLAQYPKKGATGEMAAEVIRVRDGSPAAEAGLLPGDRVVRADGRRIRKPTDFRSVMARLSPKASIAIEVRRGEATLELTLTLAADGE